MKRYIVFAYNNYEATGGWGDFLCSRKLLVSAERMAETAPYTVAHILDTESWRVIRRYVKESWRDDKLTKIAGTL